MEFVFLALYIIPLVNLKYVRKGLSTLQTIIIKNKGLCLKSHLQN